jgi:NADP-dependent aldehyde dehydrogenase
LYDLAVSRPEPIPFYGELGSVNPLVVTPAAAAARGAVIGKDVAGSVLLGLGQFCTKPGLLFVPDGADGDALLAELTAGVAASQPGHLLTAGIREAFSSGTAQVTGLPEVDVLESRAEGDGGTTTGPVLLQITAARLSEPGAHALLEEQFGPFAIVVRYSGESDLLAALDLIPAALTATVHGEDSDAGGLAPLLFAKLRGKAGRILWNGYPTGVAVTWAMQHGGPYPAATSADHTSVGAAAIRRWLRPVSYQSAPQALLPDELRDDATGVPRRIDGTLHG